MQLKRTKNIQKIHLIMIAQRNRSKSKKLLRNLKNRSFFRLQEEKEQGHLPFISQEQEEMEEIEGRIMDLQVNFLRSSENPIDQGAKKMAKFIYALYGKEVKENKSLAHKINGTWKRIVESDVEKGLRRAEKVQQQVSVSCCPKGVLELTRLDVYEFRAELETLIREILDSISAYDAQNQSLQVARTTSMFLEQWNSLIPTLDGGFLPGYGIIAQKDVKLNVAKLVGTLKTIQKCKSVPKEIAAFKDIHFERVINSSNALYRTLKARQKQSLNVWRYSFPA